MEQVQELQQILTELELLKAKDIREVKDAIRILAGKIDRLTSNDLQSPTIGALTAAKAQALLEANPLKESGTGNRGKYSTLEDYRAAFEKPLAKNGLVLSFTPSRISSNEWVLVTLLSHSSGEWIKSVLPISAPESSQQRNEEQGYGASISYMQRYSYAAIMGV
jgi:hypothetical protein